MVSPSDIVNNIFFFLEFALECLLLYVITTQTPPKMKNIQAYLFMITFGEICVLLCYGIFVIPEGVRGLPGVTVNGLFRYLKDYGGVITIVIGCIVFCFPSVCILLCSLVRLLIVCDVTTGKFKPLFIFGLCCSIVGPSVIVPPFYDFITLDKERLLTIATKENLTEVLEDLASNRRPYMIADLTSPLIVLIGGCFMLACAGGAAVTVIINLVTMARSKHLMNSSSISAARHDLQRRLTMTLLAQVGVPIITGIIVFIICIPMIRDYFATGSFDASEVNSILYYVAAAYYPASAIPTLILIRPYQQFVRNLITRNRRNRATRPGQTEPPNSSTSTR